MMIVGNGFNLGAALGGFVAAWLIPNFGWRSVFYFGGAVPLVVAILMIFFLPESLQLMVLRGADSKKIAKALKPIHAAAPAGDNVEYVIREEKKGGVPVVHLFSGGRALVTVLLWLVFFLNLLNLYLLSSWLPTIVTASGYTTSTAVLVGTTLQAGGAIGGIVLAFFIARVGLIRSLWVGFAVAAFCVASIGQPGLAPALMFVVVFVAGWGILGGQTNLNSLAASYYPTYLRSTGVGWCLGIGRTGAIVGPLFAGELMRRNWPNQQLFMAAASLALLATVVMFSLNWLIKPTKEVGKASAVMVH
jgi:AAHS family 4-hydroxybenzoate transporter-like MFS transporter